MLFESHIVYKLQALANAGGTVVRRSEVDVTRIVHPDLKMASYGRNM
jgi:hypothetical protein